MPDAAQHALEPGVVTQVLATATPFAVPLVHRFRGVTVREGLLLRGPAGWAEFAPFADYDVRSCVPWLRAALEACVTGWPAPVRDRVEVNVTVPVLPPDDAFRLVRTSGCRTAKVKVADPGVALAADADRVAAVRAALGPAGRIRVDANAAWTVDQAVHAVAVLAAAAGGLEYVEQPCPGLPELAAVRRRVDVPVAADESIRLADDPARVALAGAADVAVIKVAPLGGVRAARRIAALAGLPAVVSSALDTSIGLAAGLALAGALPAVPFACGLATADLLAGDLTSKPWRVVDGSLPVPTRAPEPDRLAEFAPDRDTAARWRRRLDAVAARAAEDGAFGRLGQRAR